MLLNQGQLALSQTHLAQFGNKHSPRLQEIWTWALYFGQERNIIVVHADQTTLQLAKSIFACITCKDLIWLQQLKVQNQPKEMSVNQIFQSRLRVGGMMSTHTQL